MNFFLEKLFIDSSFKIIKEIGLVSPETFIAESNAHGKINYFFVVFLNAENLDEFISYRVPFLLEEIKETSFFQAEMEKNMSLLVCLKVTDSEIDENLEKKIFELEEDPYDFKKYLLNYTNEQVDKLKMELDINEGEIDLVGKINTFLLDTIKFNEFKESTENNEAYSLATKIFIKLPFIKIDINEDKEMENIEKIIEDKLIGKNALKLTEYRQSYINYGKSLINDQVDEDEILQEIYKREGITVE
ncbi:ABC-three component system middle component 1 [Lysinibacillus xylanilyticus]|uniref:ABC-three component system middle component 1 n=1 Tax=Lysinibacillus xylanilyticus TaxID=582475 RepID=UPI003D08BD68